MFESQKKFSQDLSFEFFPPKNEEGKAKLISVAKSFNKFNPKFFSVTYGAGGSHQENTVETVLDLKENTATNVAPHITCIGASKKGVGELLNSYEQQDINHLVALRGDLPVGQHHDNIGDFKYAVDLIEFIRDNNGEYFTIDVAAYPEYHPESPNAKIDLTFFKQKVAAGANGAITQYFYNFDAYSHFIDNCERENIDIPIVPGIMPIFAVKQIEKFSDACGAELPRWLRKEIESRQDDPASVIAYGIDVVTELCAKLLAAGAPGLHFYTLNKEDICLEICNNLQLANA